MRIVTVAMPVASTPAEVYAKADVDALLAMLVHKIGQVVMQQGIEQGQGLLQDWLVLFVAAYNNHKGLLLRSPQEVGMQSLKTLPWLLTLHLPASGGECGSCWSCSDLMLLMSLWPVIMAAANEFKSSRREVPFIMRIDVYQPMLIQSCSPRWMQTWLDARLCRPCRGWCTACCAAL